MRGAELLQKAVRKPKAKAASEPEPAEEADALRQKIQRGLPKYSDLGDEDDLEVKARRVFAKLLLITSQLLDLTNEEVEYYEHRFTDALLLSLKHLDFENMSNLVKQNMAWVETSMSTFAKQKPTVTAASVEEINSGDLGWTATLQEWMKDISVEDYRQLLGKVIGERHKESLLLQQRRASPRKARLMPASFDAREQWPVCNSTISRVLNQGHCGSCWAFGSMASVDSRLCIATEGRFLGEPDMLSRGYATSCAKEEGCQGGTSSYTFDLIGTKGIPSGGSGGCSPYFAEGEGLEHFQQSGEAPPCPRACHPLYPRTMAEDTFVLKGMERYQEVWNSEGATSLAKEAILKGGPVPFGLYASAPFMSYASGVYDPGCQSEPNHEVVSIGWGSDAGKKYFIGTNSWGTRWGDAGRFKVLECGPTDWTLPGSIIKADSLEPLPLPENQPYPTPAPAVGFRRTVEGCTCLKSWSLENASNSTCEDYCCNPDDDPNGDWCFVVDEQCEGGNYGTCESASSPVAPQPTPSGGHARYTKENCECQEVWTLEGGGQLCDHSCCNPDDDAGGDWCFVISEDCQGTNYGYCVDNSTPPDSEVDIIPVTRKGCACKQDWDLVDAPGGCDHYCCNPDHREADWCFVDDTECEGAAWGFCEEEAADLDGSLAAWSIKSGECSIDGAGCVCSPEYPRQYQNSQMCFIDIGNGKKMIHVADFNTEKGYDLLTVNGKEYSGSVGPDGVIPTERIKWESDSSGRHTGWKLCPEPAPVAVDVANMSLVKMPLSASSSGLLQSTVKSTRRHRRSNETRKSKVQAQLRRTTRGCACKSAWALPASGSDSAASRELACEGACCNPDGDSKGSWCLVESVACEGRRWGYCS